MKKLIGFIFGVLLVINGVSFAATLNSGGSPPIIGILVPLEVESHYIMQTIKDKKEVTINGIHYTLGMIGNKNIVFALSGLGKINQTIVATQLLNHFNPELIILSGSSGIVKQKINIGDVVIGKVVENVDLGTLDENGHTFDYNMHNDLYQPQVKKYLPLAFALPPAITRFLTKLNETSNPKFLLGKIASSEVIPNPQQQVRLMNKINVDVVEMEGASLMQICWFFQKPCIVVRGASNFTGKKFTSAEVSSAADNAAKVAVEIINNMNIKTVNQA